MARICARLGSTYTSLISPFLVWRHRWINIPEDASGKPGSITRTNISAEHIDTRPSIFRQCRECQDNLRSVTSIFSRVVTPSLFGDVPEDGARQYHNPSRRPLYDVPYTRFMHRRASAKRKKSAFRVTRTPIKIASSRASLAAKILGDRVAWLMMHQRFRRRPLFLPAEGGKPRWIKGRYAWIIPSSSLLAVRYRSAHCDS